MTVESDRMLRMTREFTASPERVFDAWINPKIASKWLFASPIDEAYNAEMDPRIGGKWSITARREGQDYTASGEYLEVDRPRRLVFTFAMPQFSPNSDCITVEIAPREAGCIMTFTQSGTDIADELRQVEPGAIGGSEQGWIWMFQGLEQALA